ncbi:DUF2993 domain-containing protein [Anaeroselena agilis]|uniref:DUF2993 domain-containing protein n=1 Tax=Anaeroselena agilis TaxID=3063788 RepID=A0ABU3P4G8_9FIRM|nr:DUF2993 domain-containing protein [Selenomonadales bacterium 4137-cl]
MLIIAVIVAGEVAIPSLVGNLIARGMTGATGSSSVSAQVAKRPAFLMFDGRFDSVRIHANDSKVDKITFAELDATLKDVALDMPALITQGKVAFRGVRDVDLTAVITQDELSRFLNQTVKGVKNAKVRIEPDKINVSANFILGQIASIAIALDGKVVGDGHRIKFVTDRFLINNTAVGNIGGSVLTEIPLVDLRKLPFGVKAKKVVMDAGKITITADNRTP